MSTSLLTPDNVIRAEVLLVSLLDGLGLSSGTREDLVDGHTIPVQIGPLLCLASWQQRTCVWRTASALCSAQIEPRMALICPSYVRLVVPAAPTAGPSITMSTAPSSRSPTGLLLATCKVALQNVPLTAFQLSPSASANDDKVEGPYLPASALAAAGFTRVHWHFKASFRGVALEAQVVNTMAYVAETDRLAAEVLVVEVALMCRDAAALMAAISSVEADSTGAAPSFAVELQLWLGQQCVRTLVIPALLQATAVQGWPLTSPVVVPQPPAVTPPAAPAHSGVGWSSAPAGKPDDAPAGAGDAAQQVQQAGGTTPAVGQDKHRALHVAIAACATGAEGVSRVRNTRDVAPVTPGVSAPAHAKPSAGPAVPSTPVVGSPSAARAHLHIPPAPRTMSAPMRGISGDKHLGWLDPPSSSGQRHSAHTGVGCEEGRGRAASGARLTPTPPTSLTLQQRMARRLEEATQQLAQQQHDPPSVSAHGPAAPGAPVHPDPALTGNVSVTVPYVRTPAPVPPTYPAALPHPHAVAGGAEGYRSPPATPRTYECLPAGCEVDGGECGLDLELDTTDLEALGTPHAPEFAPDRTHTSAAGGLHKLDLPAVSGAATKPGLGSTAECTLAGMIVKPARTHGSTLGSCGANRHLHGTQSSHFASAMSSMNSMVGLLAALP